MKRIAKPRRPVWLVRRAIAAMRLARRRPVTEPLPLAPAFDYTDAHPRKDVSMEDGPTQPATGNRQPASTRSTAHA